MKPIVPFPSTIDIIDDQVHITYSDESVKNLGRFSGYPGTQMSELDKDESGEFYWTDPVGERKDLGILFGETTFEYVGLKSGLFQGTGISEYYQYAKDNYASIPGLHETVNALELHPSSVPPINENTYCKYPDGVEVFASNYSNSYPLYRAFNGTTSNTTDGFRWGKNSVGDRSITVKLPSLAIFSGVTVHSSTSTYGIETAEVQVLKPDGTWVKVLDIVASDLPLNNKLFSPVPGTAMKLVETGSAAYAGIGRFEPLLAKGVTSLEYFADPEWYDKNSVKVAETDTSFLLEPTFTDPIGTVDAITVPFSKTTVLTSTSNPGKSEVKAAKVRGIVPITKSIYNGIGIEVTGKKITFPKGHYVIDLTYTAKNDAGSAGPDVGIGLYNVSLDTLIAPMVSMYGANVANFNGDIPLQGRMEFYLEAPMDLIFVEEFFTAYSFIDTAEDRLKVTIQQLSTEPLPIKHYGTMQHTRKNLLADFDPLTISVSVSEEKSPNLGVNVLNEFTSNGNGWLDSVTGNPSVIELELPETINPTGWSVTTANNVNTYVPITFQLECKNTAGEWVVIDDVKHNLNSTIHQTYENRLSLPEPSKHFRVTFLKNSANNSAVEIATIRLHSDELIRNDRISATAIKDLALVRGTSDYLVPNYSQENITGNIYIRVDHRCRIWVRMHPNRTAANVKHAVTKLFPTEEEIPTYEFPWLEPAGLQQLTDIIEPGIYYLDYLSGTNSDTYYLEYVE